MDRALFSTRTIILLIAVGVLAFTGALLISIFGNNIDPQRRVGPNSFSKSAIGHRAFLETLRGLRISVRISRARSAQKSGANDLLVVMEPPLDAARPEMLGKLLDGQNVLLVLPKWRGLPDPKQRSWIRLVGPVAGQHLQGTLEAAGVTGKILNGSSAMTWVTDDSTLVPNIQNPHVIQSADLEPFIFSDEGILLGRRRLNRQTLWVLSDPDLLSNHGLRRGDNAAIIIDIINSVRRGGHVIIDETVHGFILDPNLGRVLLRRPFVAVTILGLATLAVLLWAAAGRFGAAIPAAPRFQQGKFELIRNTAGLLEFGGHTRETFLRYLNAMMRDVARRVHAPRGLGDAGRVRWLDEVGRSGQIEADFGALYRDAEDLSQSRHNEPGRHAALAQRLYHWRQEMLHGRRDRTIGQSRH